MKIIVNKSKIHGSAAAPSSKSYTIRGLMCAALARGKSRMVNPLVSDDTEAALRVLTQIGVKSILKDELWEIVQDGFQTQKGDLYCGESAATLRFMTAIGALIPGGCRLTAGPSLSKRPVKTLADALLKWGVDVASEGDFAPVLIKGGGIEGGLTELPGNISSQFVSALLLAGPLCKKPSMIHLTTGLESGPYVLMTLECLEKFGIKIEHSDDLLDYEIEPQQYQPAEYRVEGDWSSGSYLLALGAAAGEIVVSNLNRQSLQGDREIIEILKRMGAEVEESENGITVRKSDLGPVKADLNESIDLLPTVAVLAALAEGTSVLSGIKRARLKESDRIASVRKGLERAGIRVVEEADRLIITGGQPQGAVIDCQNDHRIAMAFSIMGAAAGNIALEGAECVSKTFPEYWQMLRELGVKLDEQ